MSKVYLYSNIILVIISIIALILSILDIIVQESGQQQDGCPKSGCTINAESITAKTCRFDRIISQNTNDTLTINTLSNLNLGNTKVGNLISENININTIVNNVDLSNNSITIGTNKNLNFKSFSIFLSDIGTTNLSSNNISCVTSNFSNLLATSINSSNLSGTNLKTNDASFKDIKGNYVICKNATFTNITFTSSSSNITNISLNNPSVTKLSCTNCTVSNISSTLNISVTNIFYKSLQCTNMNTKGSLLSATNISFTNLLNKSLIQSENFITNNINELNDIFFVSTNAIINCSNIVGLANFSFSNISSTNNLVNNIYKFGNFTNPLDAYIKNLTCTDLITKDTIFIDNLPLNDSYTNLESNNINYTINIETILNTPFTRNVTSNSNLNNLLLQVDLTFSKKITMRYATYNSSKLYDFSACLYIYPGDGYFSDLPNNMDLIFSSDITDITLFLGMSFRCIFDTKFKPPDFPYVLKISNRIIDFTLEVISNKNIYDKSTKFSQNIITNGDPALINIYKGQNQLDFLINVLVTCTNVDMINKKIVFLILPI